LKASENITNKLTPNVKSLNVRPSENMVSKNLNVSVYAFIIQCFWNLLVSLYQRRKNRVFRQSQTHLKKLGYDILPKSKWLNEYPIVVVHGYCGWAPEEGQIWGNYWDYISDPHISAHHLIY
jgi:hypothetical protein